MNIRAKHPLRFSAALLACGICGVAQTNGYYNAPTAPQAGASRQRFTPQGFVGAGSLNYVEGQVSSNGQPLTLQSIGRFALQPGQSLETGNGYAEVLLTPGAFARVGPDSEFRMTAVGLADTRIVLTRGNALVEADQLLEGTHLEVTLGTTSVDVLKKGLYGFSTNPPEVRTYDGKVEVVGMTSHRDIGKHDQILLAGNDNLKKTSFDENQAKKEPLYVWSEARSREESAQNKLVAQNPDGYAPSGGGWFWDPYAGYYGFWPSAYFYSPFGFGFYGGFYPGFYGGGYGGFRGGLFGRGHFVGGVHRFGGFHGNGVGGFHGGGFHGGGFHGGGHR